MSRLADRIAIITGAAAGIGAFTARAFAREGGCMKGTAAYSASKGAVRLLTKSVALEAAANPRQTRVNSVLPGRRIAGQNAGQAETTREEISALHPIGRMGTPDEVANAILFLASDESSFMTGSELVVDGGYTAI